MTSPCVSCVPCEKLRRKTSVPAAISARSDSSLSHAGPMVAMILVWRMKSLRVRGTGYRVQGTGGRGGFKRDKGVGNQLVRTPEEDWNDEDRIASRSARM